MQWLIDILWDMLLARGIFVDFGDAPGWHYGTLFFTCDGNWHDFDLSTLCPENAKGVLLHGFIVDDLVGSYMQFRTRGNVNVFNRSEIRTQVANIIIDGDFVVPLDSSRFIQYRFSNVFFGGIGLVVKGWWF